MTSERLSVNINDESAEIIRRYARETGVSTTETVRRAIGLLGYFLDSQEAGNKVFVIDPAGNEWSVNMP